MKIKNILYLIIFMPVITIESKSGKAAANKPAPVQQQPAPKQPQQKPAPQKNQQPQAQETYTSLLSYIRNASPQMIFKDGDFTPDFLNNKIQGINDPTAVASLLQAARNLHMPLSANDQDNAHLITQSNKRISDLMNGWFGVPAAQQPKSPQQQQPKSPQQQQPKSPQQQQPAKGNQPKAPQPKPVHEDPISITAREIVKKRKEDLNKILYTPNNIYQEGGIIGAAIDLVNKHPEITERSTFEILVYEIEAEFGKDLPREKKESILNTIEKNWDFIISQQ